MDSLITSLSPIDYAILTQIIPKVVFATIVGAIVGFSREKQGKSAGLKTHILLCVGAAIFTACSLIMVNQAEGQIATTRADATRIVAQIVSGIGFLGAGTIFRAENKVYGLTSAAFIWVVSALGVLVGLGGYFSTVLLAIGCVGIISLVNRVEAKFFPNGNGNGSLNKH